MNTPELIRQLSPAATVRLLERRAEAAGWVLEFCRLLGRRVPPTVKIATRFTGYSPLSNVIAIQARALMELDERSLKIVVAHECGHFKRRWPSLFSWTTVAKLKEEIRADRVAIKLTGATLDEWAKSVRDISERESDGALNSEVTELRHKVLSEWLIRGSLRGYSAVNLQPRGIGKL